MRNAIFLLLLNIQASDMAYSKGTADTALIEKIGWLVYWHDNIIWVEAALNKKIKDAQFFEMQKEYTNGVNIKGNINATVYKSIAKGYPISYYHNDSVVGETDPNFLDSIWILPVKGKYKTGFEAAFDTMTLSFIKNKREIFIKYKNIADYDIREITLLRKCDKRKIKRVKSYSVPLL